MGNLCVPLPALGQRELVADRRAADRDAAQKRMTLERDQSSL